jgi:hypothetical protein
MILCSNSCKSNVGLARASGLLLSAVLDEVITESENCLSQNHKLFGYFLAAKSIKEKILNSLLPIATGIIVSYPYPGSNVCHTFTLE